MEAAKRQGLADEHGMPRFRRPITGYQRSRAASKGPDGVGRLEISAPTWINLCKMELPLIADVEQADRDGRLTRENGFGPLVLKRLRQAMQRHRECLEDVGA